MEEDKKATEQMEQEGQEKKIENDDNNKNNNTNNNIDQLPEPDITEEEMKDLINYISTWDYEKYERDAEVREALLLLRHKMQKEEEEKEAQLQKLKEKENIDNNIKNEESKNEKENIINEYIQNEEKQSKINENNINNVIKDELSEQEKDKLEKNWNSSTRPDFGDKIVNEKGDKEVILSNDKPKKIKNVNFFILIFYIGEKMS